MTFDEVLSTGGYTAEQAEYDTMAALESQHHAEHAIGDHVMLVLHSYFRRPDERKITVKLDTSEQNLIAFYRNHEKAWEELTHLALICRDEDMSGLHKVLRSTKALVDVFGTFTGLTPNDEEDEDNGGADDLLI